MSVFVTCVLLRRIYKISLASTTRPCTCLVHICPRCWGRNTLRAAWPVWRSKITPLLSRHDAKMGKQANVSLRCRNMFLWIAAHYVDFCSTLCAIGYGNEMASVSSKNAPRASRPKNSPRWNKYLAFTLIERLTLHPSYLFSGIIPSAVQEKITRSIRIRSKLRYCR